MTDIDERKELIVEKIIARKGHGKSLQYRVKWVGCKNSKNTWEKVANLSGAKKIIDEFEEKEIEKKARLSNREVEKIVNEKINKDETLFLVKWKGYKSEKNSWEPREKLNETAKEAIEQWTNTKVKIEEKKAASAVKKAARKKEAKAKRDAKKEAKKAAKQENSKEAESVTEKLVTAETASPEQTTAETKKPL